MITTVYKCSICGKVTAGRIPRGGDGSFRYPRKHNDDDGKLCPGVYYEAILTTVPCSKNATTGKIKPMIS